MTESTKAKILSVGAMSPLGLTALQVTLALRASKFSPRRTPMRDTDGGGHFGTARCRALPDDVYGDERIIALAKHALGDALRTSPIDRSTFADGSVPLVLALADTFEAGQVESCVRALEDGAAVRFDRKRSETLRVGAAGFVVAIQRALTKLGARGDGVVLVGAADSYFDVARLDALHRAHRLHGPGVKDGFIPSEGAAFFVLGGVSHPAPALALIRAAVAGLEERSGDDDINLATEATRVLRQAFASSAVRPLPWVLTDSNGERHREREWTFASLRNQDAVESGKTVLTKLVSEAGDAGAANGALMAAHVAVSFQHKVTEARQAGISIASEGAERGALLLEAT